MELIEGVGESSSPLRTNNNNSSFIAGGAIGFDIRNDVYNRLIDNGNHEAISNPEEFREELDNHFNRFPARYGLDVNMDRVEDVLLHQKLLAEAKDPEKRPVFHVRFIESCIDLFEGHVVGIRTKFVFTQVYSVTEGRNSEQEAQHLSIHEVIFSTLDKPKLLSQLSALLSDIGLNIREAHVFSTIDGYSLDVFVVDGWPDEDTDGLWKAVETAVSKSEVHPSFVGILLCAAFLLCTCIIFDYEQVKSVIPHGSWSGSSSSSHTLKDKSLAIQLKPGDWEIDIRLLKIEEKIASGSCGDLYRGTYLGNDVAVKVLKSEHLNEDLELEFAQEVKILRKVQHRNVVRFIGACSKRPQLCIITEFMPGGSLYDYLHKNRNVLDLRLLLKFAIDVCNGMEYLHRNNIIHRDLKTANLLMDTENVVKVADFGVARFQIQGGVMTAETGTYRWMAPEVINHQPYDQKADVFSFAIVLWELTTAKVPYDTLTPLQAALGVRQGLRPDLPENVHPKILDLMQRCWEALPMDRPSFSEIRVELEELLEEVRTDNHERRMFRLNFECAMSN
ncbi:non-specific serine/threonine protein kinase [Ranunculus cassubicifolius]